MPGEWPADQLDVAGLLATGWLPTPFRQFVIKVHGRCDLRCDYCYMYELADQSWRTKQSAMPPDTLHQTCLRIAQHAERHRLRRVEVVFHGGEPLLAGPAVLAQAATTLRALVPCAVDLGVQTNGMRLDEPILRTLHEHDIRVGVSLDGDQRAHDKRRRFADGRGSYDRAARAIGLLRRRYRHLYSGLLCVVDLDADPVATYEALLEHEPPRLDLLLPHANWSAPPRRGGVPAPYGDWLAGVFDRWYGSPRQETEIRLFQEIINLALGGHSRSEAVGLSPVAMIVVDTDGSMEQVDSLRSAYQGAADTGFNVFDHDFEDALAHPAIAARQIGVDALSDTCRSCDIHKICGGGHYPHRYQRGTGFRHASVYCPDLLRLISHVSSRLRGDLIGGRP